MFLNKTFPPNSKLIYFDEFFNIIVSILSFYSMTKPADFTECVGDELPVGWEQAYDYQRGIYYVDHINSKRIFLYILSIKYFSLFYDKSVG